MIILTPIESVSVFLGLYSPLVSGPFRFDSNRLSIHNSVDCRLCPAWLSIVALLRSSTLQAINDQSPMALITYEFVVTIATYIGPQLTQTTQHSMIGYIPTHHALCSFLFASRLVHLLSSYSCLFPYQIFPSLPFPYPFHSLLISPPSPLLSSFSSLIVSSILVCSLLEPYPLYILVPSLPLSSLSFTSLSLNSFFLFSATEATA